MNLPKCYLLLLFSSLLFNALQSQPDTTLAFQYQQNAEAFFYKGQAKKALPIFRNAFALFNASGEKGDALNAVNWIAACYYALQQPDSLGITLSDNKALANNLSRNNPGHHALMTYWNYKAFDFDRKGDYTRKLKADLKALQVAEQQPEFDTLELAKLYQNYAVSLGHLGDHRLAIDFAEKALHLYQPGHENYLPETRLAILNTLGKQHELSGQNEKALFYFQQGVDISALNKNLSPAGKSNFTEILTSLGAYYCKADHLELADEYLLQARQIALMNNDAPPFQHPVILKNLGILYHKKKDAVKALNYLEEASQLVKKSFGNKNNFTSGIYKATGDFYENNPEQALSFYQKALTAISLEFNDSTNYARNPDLNNSCYSKPRLLEILMAKAAALHKFDKLDAALATCQLAAKLIQDMRQNYQADDSKLLLQEKAVSFFENTIEVALAMDEKEAAWQFAEQSKAVLLQENLTDAKAKLFSQVDANLLQKESELKMETGYLERKLYAAQNKKDTAKVALFTNQLFATKRDYQKLLDTLATAYPRYHALKFEEPELSVVAVQKSLGKEDVVLEYFFGTSNIYCFAIFDNNIKTYVTAKPVAVTNAIALFRKQLLNPSMQLQDFYEFRDLGHELYTMLAAPAIDDFPQGIKNLTVVPDGALGYIPFQALVRNASQEQSEARYDKLDFLVNEFQISYAYALHVSTTFKKIVTKNLQDEFIGFAPVFNGQRGSYRDGTKLNSLLYNLEEVMVIDSIISGTVYVDSMATVERFLQHTNTHKILHLSTHARLDDASPLNSKIYFDDDYFTVGQIYGLPALQSRLAVLSACNTGTGELKKGEGIMSLSRAFMYAGCPALLSSLWQVEDEKTAGLMVDFYKALSAGKRQDEALREAQQAHLDNNLFAKHSHPYYWAAFVHIGDKSPLFDRGGMSGFWWKFLVGNFVLLLIIWFLRPG